jgi:hypothetical protein
MNLTTGESASQLRLGTMNHELFLISRRFALLFYWYEIIVNISIRYHCGSGWDALSSGVDLAPRTVK